MATAARRAGQHALLDEERLVHVFDRFRLLADADGQGAEPDRPTCGTVADSRQDGPVDLVEPAAATPSTTSARPSGGSDRDGAVAAHFGVVARVAGNRLMRCHGRRAISHAASGRDADDAGCRRRD
jgi:hypothetical protein